LCSFQFLHCGWSSKTNTNDEVRMTKESIKAEFQKELCCLRIRKMPG